MKKLFIASGLLALMAAATSCDKYDIYDEQYGDVMLIKDGGDVSMDVYSTDDYADRYISVLKGGHSPERTSSASLRVMTEQDFRDYKELNYGDADFGGLQMVDASLFDLLDSEGNVTKEISHVFSGSGDRYFGATLRIYSEKFSKWNRSDEIQAEIGSKEYVIPIGLYSETDSVNEYNNVLMVRLNDLDPKISCDVANGSYDIKELSRRALIRDAGKGLVYEPEVYLSIPCKNTWGFGVAIKSTSPSDINSFNGDSKNKITLTALTNDKAKDIKDEDGNVIGQTEAVTRWELTESREFGRWNDMSNTTEHPSINFPVGETKARVPLKIYLDYIDPDEMLNKNLVVPITIANSKGATAERAIAWDDVNNMPSDEVIKKLIDPMTFFIGVRPVETPLELDDTCVTSNDCEDSEGSIAALFDDDLSTFFHSSWRVAKERSAPYGSYLEITLPEEVNSVYFNITARNSNQRSPKKIDLYYSNDIDDEDSWQYFATAINKKTLKAGESFEIGKINNMYKTEDGQTFKFMRFCVVENEKGESLFTTSTAIYWNLAELKLYGKIQEVE